jgi:N-methylhydantoinase A
MTGLRTGIDTGGTFTDLVALTPRGLRQLKLPSTPDDPAWAVRSGLAELTGGAPLGPGDRVAHGTTVATNALLTGRTAPIALLTTEGFEDVIAIGRQDRPALYDLQVCRPAPLVGPERRLGVRERIGPDGGTVIPLEAEGAALREVFEHLAALEPPAEAVAVCLLHAYARADHEEELGRRLAERFPGLPLTLSSRLLPLFREYERTSTVVVNAAVLPVMGRYLDRLREATGAGRLTITASSGGTLSARQAASEPARTLLSGPAAGVAGALAVAGRAGCSDIMSFDMGGTSTDVALCEGRIRTSAEGEIGGYPVALPQVDLHTVGAGGGSLARIDLGGALVVGPASAGADPGPLAYGRRASGPRGEGVTVTDADLLLGRLPAGGLLGGRMPLDGAAARRGLEALAAAAGRAPGSSGPDAVGIAEGVVRVTVAAMAGALRRISVERGKDPRAFTLVAFGGAGAMHAAALAREMGIGTILVPREPGLLSAVGTLVTGLRVDTARTVLGRDPQTEAAALEALWRELDHQAGQGVRAAGAPADQIRLVRRADLRYRGQSFEITVEAPPPDEPFGEEGWRRLQERFADLHQERYGYRRPDTPVELVALRSEGHGPGAARLEEVLPPLPEPARSSSNRPPEEEPLRPMVWEGRVHATPQVSRESLAPRDRLRGPLLIHEFSATTVVPPGDEVEVNPWGDLIIRVGA